MINATRNLSGLAVIARLAAGALFIFTLSGCSP